MTTLKQRVAKKLGVNESELIWSEYSTNPEQYIKVILELSEEN